MCCIINNVVSPLVTLFSNIITAVIISILFLVSSIVQKKAVKNIRSNIIAAIAILIALSVVLNRIVSMPFQFGPSLKGRIELGKFLIFIIGIIYGPFFGVLSAICADVIGLMFLSGTYHVGFMFNAVLYGFFGAMVFAFKSNKWWQAKAIGIYFILFMIESFVLTPFWLYATAVPWKIIAVGYTSRLIKAPVVIVYILLMLSSFKIVYHIVLTKQYVDLWVLRKGRVNFDHKKDNVYRKNSKLIS